MIMKKIFLLITCLFLFSYSAKAEEKSTCAETINNEQQTYDNGQAVENPSAENTWDREYNQILDEKYGSVESPAFLNRENIDSDDSDDDSDEAGSE